MSIEQHFADAINADPDDRTLQLVYADWLDEQGDPRAEAWRVLVEAGKRPSDDRRTGCKFRWDWWPSLGIWERAYGPNACLPDGEYDLLSGYVSDADYKTFYAAMNAAAIAWVRCHRDAEFEPDELTERVN